MINLLGILGLLIIEAILIGLVIFYYMNKLNDIDEEILQRDKLLVERMKMIKKRNIIIKEKILKIEELENEIKRLKRKNNK